MARPLRARVDLTAIRRNHRRVADLAPGTQTLAVVKADAYGHGAVEVSRALAARADGFAVASLEEALVLRRAGIDSPILLMAGFFSADELPELARHRLDTVVHCREQLESLLAARLDAPLRVWLKMDSGMHRLGLPPESFAAAHDRLRAAPQVADVVLMTHLSHADVDGEEVTPRQIDTFRRGTPGLEGPGSLAKSAAVLAWPESHGDWIRVGIALYGVSPLDRPHAVADRLEPAMELVSEIIAVRELRAGEAVGYGGRYVCRRDTRIGVVAAGYADGYPRHARDGTPVLVGGRRARLAGRVSMDLITVDLEGLGDVAVGDPVELWGKALSANEVADACGTIAYELFTGVAARVPRVYHG